MQIIADLVKLQADPLSKNLIDEISGIDTDESFVFYNFPFYLGETTEENVHAQVMLVSRKYGVICFKCLPNSNLCTNQDDERLDNLDNHLFARISKFSELRSGKRELKINILCKIFTTVKLPGSDNKFVTVEELKQTIFENESAVLTDSEFTLLCSAIDGSDRLQKKKEREVKKPSSKGDILNTIQNQHSTFDIEQKIAALNIIDSPQRIRGLAGSGKTIILAMKVAQYHLLNPEADILYTYYTKALHGQVKYLIEKYYKDFSGNKAPNWSKIHILHGWGGGALRGVYSETCKDNFIAPINFLEAKAHNPNSPFSYIFGELESQPLKARYDLTLIDEGQDFPASFYRVCRKITKDMRIAWAYDDFQNIFNIKIQDEKETFGKDENGVYYVDFSKNLNPNQDIVLKRCYRNSRFGLITAFALGLGIYNEKVLQRLEDNKHWEDLGFEVEAGDSSEGSKMIISRPEINSPSKTNELFGNESITIELFDSLEEECNFIVKNIVNDITEQELRPDDISVIGIDNKNIKVYFDYIETRLKEKGIKSFNHLNTANNNTSYSVDGCVTLSSLNKAKGNESGMVYVVGVDYIFTSPNNIVYRNKLFTGITRSKGWVSLTGFNLKGSQCLDEINKLRAAGHKFIFNQPSKEDSMTIFREAEREISMISKMDELLKQFETLGFSRDEALAKLDDYKATKK